MNPWIGRDLDPIAMHRASAQYRQQRDERVSYSGGFAFDLGRALQARVAYEPFDLDAANFDLIARRELQVAASSNKASLRSSARISSRSRDLHAAASFGTNRRSISVSPGRARDWNRCRL
jgi:hypothetical protein